MIPVYTLKPWLKLDKVKSQSCSVIRIGTVQYSMLQSDHNRYLIRAKNHLKENWGIPSSIVPMLTLTIVATLSLWLQSLAYTINFNVFSALVIGILSQFIILLKCRKKSEVTVFL